MTVTLLLCLVIVRGLLFVAHHGPTLLPVVVVGLVCAVVFYLLSLVVVPPRDRRPSPPRTRGALEAVQHSTVARAPGAVDVCYDVANFNCTPLT
jgi:hypothetical protein